jgi:hypothetical protein
VFELAGHFDIAIGLTPHADRRPGRCPARPFAAGGIRDVFYL